MRENIEQIPTNAHHRDDRVKSPFTCPSTGEVPDCKEFIGNGNLELCQMNLSDVQIAASDDVYYHELNDAPGLCVEHSDGTKSWSPVNFSKREVKSASAASSDCDLDVDECSCINYERREDVPGVDIETNDSDVFWIPISHRTCSRKKSPVI